MNKIGAKINTVNHVFIKKEYSIFAGRISVLKIVGNHLFNYFVPFREPSNKNALLIVFSNKKLPQSRFDEHQ